MGDYLVVGVHTDGMFKIPINPFGVLCFLSWFLIHPMKYLILMFAPCSNVRSLCVWFWNQNYFKSIRNDTIQNNTIEQLMHDTVLQRRWHWNDCSRNKAVGIVSFMSVSITASTGRMISMRSTMKLCSRRTVDPDKLMYTRHTVVEITLKMTNEVEFDWIEWNVMKTNQLIKRLIEQMIEWTKTNQKSNQTNRNKSNNELINESNTKIHWQQQHPLFGYFPFIGQHIIAV